MAREVLELVVQRIEAGGGDIERALGEMRDLWRARLRAALEQRLRLANERLSSFQPREEYEATCRWISEVATKLAEA